MSSINYHIVSLSLPLSLEPLTLAICALPTEHYEQPPIFHLFSHGQYKPYNMPFALADGQLR